ncbi:Hypothetical predicted protein [Pelobates cultripes]|uniref:Uncharacterized protein n=1 Tax=Pelobates cultripes TaxID=61616 RepID=A0AAD1RMC7_PELCU|nr:Hypothetical predicted protein [Pelobates cultripes]
MTSRTVLLRQERVFIRNHVHGDCGLEYGGSHLIFTKEEKSHVTELVPVKDSIKVVKVNLRNYDPQGHMLISNFIAENQWSSKDSEQNGLWKAETLANAKNATAISQEHKEGFPYTECRFVVSFFQNVKLHSEDKKIWHETPDTQLVYSALLHVNNNGTSDIRHTARRARRWPLWHEVKRRSQNPFPANAEILQPLYRNKSCFRSIFTEEAASGPRNDAVTYVSG